MKCNTLNGLRKKIRLFDTNIRMLAPQYRFEAATANGTNTIYLIPKANGNAINEFADIRANVISRQELGRKRVTVDEISERHHLRKR